MAGGRVQESECQDTASSTHCPQEAAFALPWLATLPTGPAPVGLGGLAARVNTAKTGL